MTPPAGLAAVLDREARSLVERLRLWTPARWAAAAPVLGTRADIAHHLAQALADTGAIWAQADRRTLPRLDSDLVLPDQLAVTAADLVRAGAPDDVVRGAVAHLLLHRRHLLADDAPPGLAAELGLDDLHVEGATVCQRGHDEM
jgi:hypothetical protein